MLPIILRSAHGRMVFLSKMPRLPKGQRGLDSPIDCR